VLLEGVPAGLDMVSLIRSLMSQPSVTDVHDLHVWTIGSGFRALSCHIKVDEGYSLHQANQTVQAINLMLEETYNIHHATVQIECDNCNFNETFCAGPTLTEANSHVQSLAGKD
jgi:cobalt-zinc-cadmium efflux system protein